MKKTELRAVIKYFYSRGLTPKQTEIKAVLDLAFLESSFSFSIVKQNIAGFKVLV